MFHSVENTPAASSKFETPKSGIPAEMPSGKPPPNDPPAKEKAGCPASSASGQVIGGKAYPPSYPAPKAKALATPSPLKRR